MAAKVNVFSKISPIKLNIVFINITYSVSSIKIILNSADPRP